MGTWGAALYSDDTALDVRNTFRYLVTSGRSGREATRSVINEFSIPEDSVNDAVMWLALADTQWSLGRLEPRVLKKALQVIANGAATTAWTETLESGLERLAKQRVRVVEKLKQRLLTPPPPEKKLRPPKAPQTLGQTGEVFAYQLRDGENVLLVVLDDAGRFYILDWIGREIPSADEIQRLPIRRRLGGTYPQLGVRDSIAVPKKRLVKLKARRVLGSSDNDFVTSSFGWSRFDRMLADHYEFAEAAEVEPPFHTGCLHFVLAIWGGDNCDQATARKLFAAYLHKDRNRPKIKATESLTQLVAELKAEYPWRANSPDCPWACNFSASEGFMLVSLTAGLQAQLSKQIRQRAKALGLHCYDPQLRQLF